MTSHQVAGLPEFGRCAVFAILNATPDSFSDGGLNLAAAAAIGNGVAALRAGVDVLDVGGESTRPGAARVSVQEELRRVLPVVEGLVDAGGLVSVDTMRAEVVRQCARAGARIVNDVSGGLADPEMLRTVADLQLPYILMHWRGHSVDMGSMASYGDVVREVGAELTARLAAAVDAGIEPDRIVLDPGLGFAKNAEHDWALLRGQRRLQRELGRPLLIGHSRKRFLGALLADDAGVPRPAAERDAATLAVAAVAAERGAWAVRVHAGAAAADAVRAVAAMGEGEAR
ncbi:dihydropteroate synthase [Actinospica sp. MGRD01-02]|uniref:Dihydropteroate synthase n=1 Tax=Actinospica acidithermotolerans TaxID=2828514 RepID=A0A941E4M4_9ACTN|nr:dihydropteroate synthase [Actinospica acidithermotolerans]MBR7826175.1 dihydropteroate synthase [Actinospica acidithermotolerans]